MPGSRSAGARNTGAPYPAPAVLEQSPDAGDCRSAACSGATRARARSPTCSPSGVSLVRALPGRRQRRPHRRARRRDLQAPPRAERRAPPAHPPVIGPGVVVNPGRCSTRSAMLDERGISPARLRVSHAAHVIMPYHVALDERARGGGRGCDRHHAARRRPGVRRSRRAGRRPHGRPARAEAAARAARDGAGREERAARARLRPAACSTSMRLSCAGARVGRAAAAADRRHDGARPGRPGGRRARAARGRPGARCSTSTMAPTPT